MKKFTSGLAVFMMVALPAAGHCALSPTAELKTAPAPAGMEVKNGVTGTVVETMTAGGYTYVNLEKEKEKAWAACPEMAVAVGEQLTFRGCTPMMGFESKALNRTFDIIMFCGAPLPPATAALLSRQSAGSDVQVPEFDGKLAIGAPAKNARTVADLYAKSAELDKKTVTVKGKVMKVTAGIMGKTWIHLQDGTGSAFQKNNDLVLTTQELPKVGEVLTFSGTLAKDRDFGSGYKYKVIVEQAVVVK